MLIVNLNREKSLVYLEINIKNKAKLNNFMKKFTNLCDSKDDCKKIVLFLDNCYKWER